MAARRSRGRAVHGILLLDKPSGVRSNAALQRVKWLYRAKKAGHTGALDNLASGMLPICFGDGTKLSHYLLNADKSYRSIFRLGVVTDTGDADGKEIARAAVGPITETTLRETLSRFVGPIMQVPPMHSALKHQGRRLYELAYEGKQVPRDARPVTIHSLELVSIDEDALCVDVRCSKGTYIRTLAEDVGRALGCGAHVGMLRRLCVDPFGGERMFTLDEIESAAEQGEDALDALLLPPDRAVVSLRSVALDARSAYYLRQGQPVLAPHAPTGGMVRLYGADAAFLGLGEVLDDGRVAPRRLIATS